LGLRQLPGQRGAVHEARLDRGDVRFGDFGLRFAAGGEDERSGERGNEEATHRPCFLGGGGNARNTPEPPGGVARVRRVSAVSFPAGGGGAPTGVGFALPLWSRLTGAQFVREVEVRRRGAGE
ncbi:hypothetical protein ADL26_16670, partial [Thermoactinomyces vulgaris]